MAGINIVELSHNVLNSEKVKKMSNKRNRFYPHKQNCLIGALTDIMYQFGKANRTLAKFDSNGLCLKTDVNIYKQFELYLNSDEPTRQEVLQWFFDNGILIEINKRIFGRGYSMYWRDLKEDDNKENIKTFYGIGQWMKEVFLEEEKKDV